MYINAACLFFSYKFTQFYLSCLIVPGFHCADYTDSLTLLPTDRAFFFLRVSFFSFVRVRDRSLRGTRAERPETAVWPSHPFSLCLARSVWYFLYFLLFFPMVATSGGWCGTKLDLFWFCTPKIHMFAFHLLNHKPSFHISYVLIITMPN